jgi:gallate dioxygenase
MFYELAGAETLEGTHPFTLDKSLKAFRINDFLHRLVIPEHRQRFVDDLEGLMSDCKLTEEERHMIRNHQWIEMIHYGVTFFVLEKMAAVVGVSNPEVYASMRGQTLEEFQKTRKVAIQYSVAGGERASEIESHY